MYVAHCHQKGSHHRHVFPLSCKAEAKMKRSCGESQMLVPSWADRCKDQPTQVRALKSTTQKILAPQIHQYLRGKSLRLVKTYTSESRYPGLSNDTNIDGTQAYAPPNMHPNGSRLMCHS